MKVLFIFILTICCLNNAMTQSQDTTINICDDNTKADINFTIQLTIKKIEKDSMDFDSRYNLGMSYYKLVDSISFIKSIEQWNFIIKYDTCYNYVLINRGLCKLFLSDKDGFCKDLRIAKNCDYPDMTGIDNYLKEYCDQNDK